MNHADIYQLMALLLRVADSLEVIAESTSAIASELEQARQRGEVHA